MHCRAGIIPPRAASRPTDQPQLRNVSLIRPNYLPSLQTVVSANHRGSEWLHPDAYSVQRQNHLHYVLSYLDTPFSIDVSIVVRLHIVYLRQCLIAKPFMDTYCVESCPTSNRIAPDVSTSQAGCIMCLASHILQIYCITAETLRRLPRHSVFLS